MINLLLSPSGDPLDIKGMVNLRNILEVNEQMQQITLEITLRLLLSNATMTLIVTISFFSKGFLGGLFRC